MQNARPLRAVPALFSFGTVMPAMVGTSAPARTLERALSGLASVEVNILLQGEPGTRRRALAEAIHRRGPRSAAPFVTLTLGGVPDTQLELELFGAEDGGSGVIAQARNGTLYLDGIEALPVCLQRRLAQVVRVADTHRNVRIIASTVLDLEHLVRVGHFLPDLYFCIAAIRLTVPPLRERREDIVCFAEHFVRVWCAETGAPRRGLGNAAVEELRRHRWPGNERELQQTLEEALRLGCGGQVQAGHIREALGRQPRPPARASLYRLCHLERDYIATVLAQCDWNRSLAARSLGIGRNTLLRKIRSFNLKPSRAA
jgi:two-component system response regulator AtoC